MLRVTQGHCKRNQ